MSLGKSVLFRRALVTATLLPWVLVSCYIPIPEPTYFPETVDCLGTTITYDGPVNLGIVRGARQNTMTISDDALLACLPERYPGFAVTVAVSVPQNNSTRAEVTTYNPTEHNSPQSKSDWGTFLVTSVPSVLDKSASNTEANVLGAVTNVATALESKGGKKILVVADSLLSTAGDLNFLTTNWLSYDSEDVVVALGPRMDTLGLHLNEWTVYLTNSGQFSGYQSTSDKDGDLHAAQLTTLWKSILESRGAEVETRSGVDSCEFSEGNCSSHSSASPRALPSVSVVAFQPIPPIMIPDSCDGVFIPDEDLGGFEGGEAYFTHEETAKQQIAALASQLSSHMACGHMSVIGSRANAYCEAPNETNQQGDDLSTRRAEAVRDLLAQALGVSSENIIAQGLGIALPGRVEDCPNGIFNETLGQANRRVVIQFQ